MKENGEQINESEAEALKTAYEKTFSEPKDETKIESCNDFFKYLQVQESKFCGKIYKFVGRSFKSMT